jgi:hypothetical protein
MTVRLLFLAMGVAWVALVVLLCRRYPDRRKRRRTRRDC